MPDTNPPPVEVFTRFSATVDDLPAAWAFVMERIDRAELGADPTVHIEPVWQHRPDAPADDGECTCERKFNVIVHGAVDEPAAEKVVL